MPENQSLVFSADELQGGLHRTDGLFFHESLVTSYSIYLDSNAQISAYLRF